MSRPCSFSTSKHSPLKPLQVDCNPPRSSRGNSCETPFCLCFPLKQVVFLVRPAISKGGLLLPTKTRASGALLNDNALRDQLVFTAEEVECIKPMDWLLLCFPWLIGWKSVSCWYNSWGGEQWSEEEKEPKEEWNVHNKKNMVGWLFEGWWEHEANKDSPDAQTDVVFPQPSCF